MADLEIVVTKREETGKGANRRLRAGGKLPAVVYGGGRDSVPIELDRQSVLRLLKQGGGENALFLLKLSGTGKSRHTMVRKIDIDPVSRQIIHIDFQRVLLDEKVRVQVPIEIVGEADGVKNEGGVMDFITREVDVECLPQEIPARLTADVSELHIGQHLEVKDLPVPDGVAIFDPERVVVSIAHSRVAEEVEAAEEELEAGEGLIEEEPAEPEVIGREKDEDGGE